MRTQTSAAFLLLLTAVLNNCGPGVFSVPPPPSELHVAAAANLSTIFGALSTAELKATGVRLVPSFGSTAQLTQQIQAGAPFDIFLAADQEHPTALSSAGLATAPRDYARGRVVIWAPKHTDIHSLDDLAKSDVKTIAIAKPELAPYGHASVEALTNARLWDRVKTKAVYAQNISAALAYADSGNADVALTAFSLVAAKNPNAPLVPENLHRPVIQSLCILKRTSQMPAAQKVVDFLLGPEATKIFHDNGYATNP